MADDETTEAQPVVKRGKGTRAKVEIEGDVDQDVLDRVIPKKSTSSGKRAPEADSKIRFDKAIKDPNYKIVCQRIAPQSAADGTILGDSYTILGHDEQSEKEIKDELRENRGGRKWHIRVTDPETDDVIAAKTIDNVPGEPTLDPMIQHDPYMNGRNNGGGRGMGGGYQDPLLGEEEQTPEEKLEQDPEVVEAQKRIRLRKLKAQEKAQEAEELEAEARLEAAKREMKREMSGDSHDGNGNGNGKKEPDVNEAIAKAIEASTGPLRDELRRRDEKDKERDSKDATKAMIEATNAPIREMLANQQRTLDALLQKQNAPPPATGPSMTEVLAKMDAMAANIKADTNQQIQNVVNAMKSETTAQITAMNGKLDAIAAKSNDPATQALIAMAQKGGGGAGPTDPFLMMTKMTEAMQSLATTKTMLTGTEPQDLGTLVVDRVTGLAPEVMNFVERMKAQGISGADQQEMMKKMLNEYGMKMYSELDKTIKNEVRNGIQRITPRGLPAPQAAPQPMTQAPTGIPGPALPPQTVVQPGLQPVPAPPTQAVQMNPAPVNAPGVTSPAPNGMDPTLAEQYRKRVNWILTLMLKEMSLQVNAMQWPEKAYMELPGEVRDKVIAAEKAEEIHDAVKPWADPALLEKVWSFLDANHPKHEWYREWVTTGINWMKAAANPNEDEPVTEDQPSS